MPLRHYYSANASTTKLEQSKYYETVLDDNSALELDKFTKYLLKNAEKMPYQKIKGDTPNKGQRKLFLVLLKFLLKVWKSLGNSNQVDQAGNGLPIKQVTVLYVGAAPGLSIKLVDDLLKGHCWIKKWILYDSVNFDKELVGDRFEIHKRYFTLDDAAEIAAAFKNSNIKLVFMTDIRVTPDLPPKHPNYDREADKLIFENLKFDNDCICIMNPSYYCAKYRMPYKSVSVKNETFNSLQCVPYKSVWFQPWIGGGSTETRKYGTKSSVKKFLKNPESEKFKVYFTDYEQQLQHFNANQRDMKNVRINHNVRVKGICFCFDCACEIYIWEKYFLDFREIKKVTAGKVAKKITWLDKGMPSDSRMFVENSPHGILPWASDEIREKEIAPMRQQYQKYKDRKNFNRKGITADKRASASTNKLQRPEFSSKLSNKF